MHNTVVVHLLNEDPVLAEVEAMPGPTDTSVTFHNPRRRDGKPVPYLAQGVNLVVFPWHRITFIEVVSSPTRQEETIEFFRER